MSMVEDYREWVWGFEIEFYSFSCRFSAGFRLSHSMSLKMSFLLFTLILNVRSLIFYSVFFLERRGGNVLFYQQKKK